jgi:hypothetical protein
VEGAGRRAEEDRRGSVWRAASEDMAAGLPAPDQGRERESIVSSRDNGSMTSPPRHDQWRYIAKVRAGDSGARSKGQFWK